MVSLMFRNDLSTFEMICPTTNMRVQLGVTRNIKNIFCIITFFLTHLVYFDVLSLFYILDNFWADIFLPFLIFINILKALESILLRNWTHNLSGHPFEMLLGRKKL